MALESLRFVRLLKPYPQFAIRPTTRNHNMLNRNEVINTIASCVGPAHKVDLKEYELLILVELYKV